MNYMKLDKCECCNGLDIGVSLFVSGCNKHCLGCFNQEAWPFSAGQKWTIKEDGNKLIKAIEPEYIHRFSLLGGEPLAPQNIDQVAAIVQTVRQYKPSIKIWLWTGYTWGQLLEEYGTQASPFWVIYHGIDYMVEGPFIEEQKDLTLKFRGSKNQRILDIKAMREGRTPILADI